MIASAASALDAPMVGRLRVWLASGAAGTAWLTGFSGSGMTVLVDALTREQGLEAVWMTSGTPRTRAFLRDVCRNPVAVNGRRKVLVIDELDVMLGNEAAMLDVSFVVKTSAKVVPVVCVLKSTRAARECELRKKACVVLDFPPPPPDVMARVVTAVALEEGLGGAAGVDAGVVGAMCAAAPPGDLRHVLQTLRASTPAAEMRTAGLQTCDAVARVFRDCTTVDEAMVLFAGETGAVSTGIFEAYCQAAAGVEDASAYADMASCADLVDAKIHSMHRWELLDLYGCLTTGSAAVVLPPATVSLQKYGVTWNQEYARCTKAKQLKHIEFGRMEAGLSALGVDGVAAVRGMLLRSLKDRDAFCDVCVGAGLDAAAVLRVMRLWGQQHTEYKLSTHARVKKWLDAAAAGNAR